jgi:hypothetical protein
MRSSGARCGELGAETAAERTPLKGLAASGWHTAAIAMRLIVEVRPFGPHPLLGPGVDELRWLAPVHPDDVIHIEGEVVELTHRQRRSRREWYGSNGPHLISMASPSTPSLRSAWCRVGGPDQLRARLVATERRERMSGPSPGEQCVRYYTNIEASGERRDGLLSSIQTTSNATSP